MRSWRTRWAETIVFGLVTVWVGTALGGQRYLIGYICGLVLGIAVTWLSAERLLRHLKDEIDTEVDRAREEIRWTPRVKSIS